eukprot:SM000005S17197  [mRNA]  locus=s5:598760:601488:+ [translate_table: standard]
MAASTPGAPISSPARLAGGLGSLPTSAKRSSEEAGYAVRQAAGVKERRYSDHPVGDEFVRLAVDVHGALGTKWLDLLHRSPPCAACSGPPPRAAERAAWLQCRRVPRSSLPDALGHFFAAVPCLRGSLARRPRFGCGLRLPLARRAVSRRRGEPADFNAAGSWAQ